MNTNILQNIRLKKNQKKGFTLIELLVMLLVISIIVGIFTILFRRQPNSRQIKELATQNLKVFSESQGLEPIRCNDNDPDKNGYTNCTAKNQKTELLDLECTYKKQQPSCQVLEKKSE